VDSEITNIIDEIITWGYQKTSSSETDNINRLEYLLVNLYRQIIDLPEESDDNIEIQHPDFNYNEILGFVKLNFPSFGEYNEVFNSVEDFVNPEVTIGSALDDLSDIILDLSTVKWYLDNSLENEAIWQIKFSFDIHFKHHLLGLLKYIHDKK
jgi:hypothetical protein